MNARQRKRLKQRAIKRAAMPKPKSVEIQASPFCGTLDFDRFHKPRFGKALPYQTAFNRWK